MYLVCPLCAYNPPSLQVGLGALHGVGCTPWRPLVSATLPVAGVGLGALQGVGCTPCVPWSPPLCRWLLRGRCGTWCSARGRMYALASLGLRRSAWQVRRRVFCGGSDVCPGVPWSPSLCHLTHIHIRITSACNHIYYKLPLAPGKHIVNTLPK